MKMMQSPEAMNVLSDPAKLKASIEGNPMLKAVSTPQFIVCLLSHHASLSLVFVVVLFALIRFLCFNSTLLHRW